MPTLGIESSEMLTLMTPHTTTDRCARIARMHRTPTNPHAAFVKATVLGSEFGRDSIVEYCN